MKHYTFENAAVHLAGLKAAREFLEPIFIDRSNELFVVALCDDDLRLLKLLSYPGTADEVRVSIASIVRQALNSECAGMIVAHNHPSGDQRPSRADLDLTTRLCLVAEALDIVLLDHLIFNGQPAVSFRQAGLI